MPRIAPRLRALVTVASGALTAFCTFARPKSSSLIPCRVTRMFAGLRSRVYDAVPVRMMFLRDRYKRCWGKNAPPILKPVDTALRAVA